MVRAGSSAHPKSCATSPRASEWRRNFWSGSASWNRASCSGQRNWRQHTATRERKRLEGQGAQAVEGEQLRLGQELHDGLAQELTGVGMMLYALEQKLKNRSRTRALELRKLRVMLAST